MKKIITLSFVVLLMSCSAHQKVVIGANKMLKGKWSLNKITYNRSGVFKVNLYNDAPSDCFSGSIWEFIPNNNTGEYSINDEVCTSTGPKNFRFTIPEPTSDGKYSFMFKPIDQKKKSTNNDRGYRMTLEYLDANVMTWSQSVMLEGEPFVVTMNFAKM